MRTTTGKILLSASLALLMSVSAVLPVSAAEETKKEQKPTYSFTEIVEPKYEKVGSMEEGLANVRIDGKWGFVDQTGKLVIDAKYDYALPFSGGVALVANIVETELDDCFVFSVVDHTGKETPLRYDPATFFNGAMWMEIGKDGRVAAWDTVEEKDGQKTPSYGAKNYNGLIYLTNLSLYFKADGTQIIPHDPEKRLFFDDMGIDYNSYDMIGGPIDGLIPFCATCRPFDAVAIAGYMDFDGTVQIVFPSYENVPYPSDPEKTLKKGVYRVWGNDNNLALASYGGYEWDAESERYNFAHGCGLIDMDGKLITEPTYADFTYYVNMNGESVFADGGVIVFKDSSEKWGAVDRTGKVVIPFAYQNMSPFYNGYARVTDQIGKTSIIDTNNNHYSVKNTEGKVVDIKSSWAFINDLSYVTDANDNHFVISTTPVDGFFEAIPGSENLISGNEDYSVSVIEKDGKYGFVKLNVEKAQTAENPFTDVKDTDYFYQAVAWALENGVTAGASATSFDPASTCTRGQVATFLWRAAGKPEPKTTENPFKDVKESDYYYKAVLWAFENGITAGTSADAFSPNDTCTTAQIITFLWRAAGKPALPDNSGFTPSAAADTSAYYADALNWAFANGLTAQTHTGALDPNADCTRAQTVTFLYRGM